MVEFLDTLLVGGKSFLLQRDNLLLGVFQLLNDSLGLIEHKV